MMMSLTPKLKIHPTNTTSIKVHASFSGSEPGATCMQVAQMVAKANVEFTGTHLAQPDKWFEVWTEKLCGANVVIVVFSDTYRNKYTPALRKEAQSILKRLENNQIKVYIFDPSTDSAADIRNNLEDHAPFMGDLKRWVQFIQETEPEKVQTDFTTEDPPKPTIPNKKSAGEQLKDKLESELEIAIEIDEDFELAKKYQLFINEIDKTLIPMESEYSEAKQTRDFDTCTQLKSLIKSFPNSIQEFDEKIKIAGMTALELAVKSLAEDNKIDKTIDQRGRTPLMQSAVDGDVPRIRLLLKYGAQVDIQSQFGNNALIFAAIEGNFQIVELLIEAGANIDLVDSDGRTALIQAARCGFTKVVKRLLNANADKDLKDKDSETALIRAVKAGHAKITRALLSNGANIHIEDSEGKTAMAWAEDLDETECLSLLTQHLKISGEGSEETSNQFIQAAADNNVPLMLELITNGVDLNTQDKSGYSGLILAAMKGRDKAVKCLIDHQVKLNLLNHEGKSAVMEAVLFSNIYCLKLLLSAGADPNLSDKLGQTPLIRAVKKGAVKVVKLLLKFNANPNIKDIKSGQNAFEWARQKEELECLTILEASVLTPPNNEETPVSSFDGEST